MDAYSAVEVGFLNKNSETNERNMYVQCMFLDYSHVMKFFV